MYSFTGCFEKLYLQQAQKFNNGFILFILLDHFGHYVHFQRAVDR
jgi:hypothetical protein